MAVDVYPVNGMLLRRPPTHIGQEVLVRRQPSLTDLDAAPAVIVPLLVILVRTTGLD